MQPFAEICLAGHHQAAEQVAVAANVFGGRVHDDVGPQFQRPAEHGGAKGVVGHQQQPSLAGDRRAAGNVGDREQRITDRFDPEHFRFRPDRLPHRVEL